MLDFEPHSRPDACARQGPRSARLGGRARGRRRPHLDRQARLGHGRRHENLGRKLEVLREKPVVIGGTFFEVVYAQDRLDDYKAGSSARPHARRDLATATVDIPRERKLELIAEFARDFTVLSEVGSKDSSVEYTADEWVKWLQRRARRRRLEGDHRGA